MFVYSFVTQRLLGSYNHSVVFPTSNLEAGIRVCCMLSPKKIHLITHKYTLWIFLKIFWKTGKGLHHIPLSKLPLIILVSPLIILSSPQIASNSSPGTLFWRASFISAFSVFENSWHSGLSKHLPYVMHDSLERDFVLLSEIRFFFFIVYGSEK